MPCQLSPLTAGYPISAVVGTSGRALERALLVTARPLSLPSITCCAAGDGDAKQIGVCPPTLEATAGPAPLNGTWTRSRPSDSRNTSPTRCPGVPTPGDA